MNVPKEFNPSIFSAAYFPRRNILRKMDYCAPFLSGRLLDFGCGSKPYEKLFTLVTDYIGLDMTNPGHSHRNEQIDVYYLGKTIPFPDGYFDSILCTEVMEHVFDLPETLAELRRVLKPGGVMMLTVPFAICEHEVPTDFGRYTSYGMRHLMKKHGFEIFYEEKLGNSVQAMTSLSLTYLHMHVMNHIRKIPLGIWVQRLFFAACHIFAMGAEIVLKKGMELYLTNFIICKRLPNEL